MKLRLLAPRGNLPAGSLWDCPWAFLGRLLIQRGEALAVEVGDRHLNPVAEVPAPAPRAEVERTPRPGRRPR